VRLVSVVFVPTKRQVKLRVVALALITLRVNLIE